MFKHVCAYTREEYLEIHAWVFLDVGLLKLVSVKQLACGIYTDGSQQPIPAENGRYLSKPDTCETDGEKDDYKCLLDF